MPTERSSATLQFGPQISEVIDLTIESKCILPIGRRHWLMSHGGQVDNCKATLTEGNARFSAQPHPAVVWAAVTQGLRHCSHARFQISRVTTLTVPKTGNSAHA